MIQELVQELHGQKQITNCCLNVVRSEPEKQEYTKVNIWKECGPKDGLKGVIEQQLADQVRSS